MTVKAVDLCIILRGSRLSTKGESSRTMNKCSEIARHGECTRMARKRAKAKLWAPTRTSA